MKYRKKPIVIDAWQWNGEHEIEWPEWVCQWKTPEGLSPFLLHGKIWILTLEGTMSGDQGDWIIRGIKGELYLCKDDVFKATYERVEE